MKRANLNLIVKCENIDPIVLYYPYLAEESSDKPIRAPLTKWLEMDSFDKDAFAKWIRTSFSHVGEEAQVERLPYPVIYYDHAGFRAPYSFVFDANHAEAIVWKWERRLFRGSLRQLEAWLKKERSA